jgi:hypothetical protein
VAIKEISNRLYGPLPIGIIFCNGCILMIITKDTCNGCLKRPFPEVRIGNGCCSGEPHGRPATIMSNERQTTIVTDMGPCNGCKGPVTNAS